MRGGPTTVEHAGENEQNTARAIYHTRDRNFMHHLKRILGRPHCKLAQQHIAVHVYQRHPPLFLWRKLETTTLADCMRAKIDHLFFFFFSLSNSFLSVPYFFPYFLSFPFFIDSLIENYIFFQPLPSQLMQQNNYFLFIFLMFISFVLLFCFLFLSFFFISLSLCNP